MSYVQELIERIEAVAEAAANESLTCSALAEHFESMGDYTLGVEWAAAADSARAVMYDAQDHLRLLEGGVPPVILEGTIRRLIATA